MEWRMRSLVGLQALARVLVGLLRMLFQRRRPPSRIPTFSDPLLALSASKLAEKIRAGEVSSVEAVRAYTVRLRAVNAHLNAVVEERFAAAAEEALAADRALAAARAAAAAGDDGPRGLAAVARAQPLLGVPITVKESCSVQGTSLCVGSLRRRGVRAEGDGEAVRRLRAAGAIVLCTTTTPEFCVSWESNNLVTGCTRNPYDARRTSGGSSGGEAALLGAGASVIGVGSDMAGSIRVPAHFVGIFGHKPTPGYVSVDGHFPVSNDADFRHFLTVGPLCRYAEDLRLGLEIMAGEDVDRLKLREPVDMKKLRVSFMEDAGFSLVVLPVDKEIKQCVRRAASYLHSKFQVPVQKAKIPEMCDALETSLSLFFNVEGIPNLLQDPRNPKKTLNLWIEMVKSLFGISDISAHALFFTFFHKTKLCLPDHRILYYRKKRDVLKKQFMEYLGEDGVFLFPTFPEAAIFHYDVLLKTSGVLYTMIFNILGMPSTHIPICRNKDGLPIGIQVVAAPHQDRLCLAVAEVLEKGFGGWEPPIPED